MRVHALCLLAALVLVIPATRGYPSVLGCGFDLENEEPKIHDSVIQVTNEVSASMGTMQVSLNQGGVSEVLPSGGSSGGMTMIPDAAYGVTLSGWKEGT